MSNPVMLAVLPAEVPTRMGLLHRDYGLRSRGISGHNMVLSLCQGATSSIASGSAPMT
jgi:hypothetical protein